jgi:hypothetical protein
MIMRAFLRMIHSAICRYRSTTRTGPFEQASEIIDLLVVRPAAGFKYDARKFIDVMFPDFGSIRPYLGKLTLVEKRRNNGLDVRIPVRDVQCQISGRRLDYVAHRPQKVDARDTAMLVVSKLWRDIIVVVAS